MVHKKEKVKKTAKKDLLPQQMEDLFGFNSFPFDVKLSFAPLISMYKTQVSSNDKGRASFAQRVIKELDNALEFMAPVQDKSLLTEKADFLELLMSGIFPSGLEGRQLGMASQPFSMEGFYMTTKMAELKASNSLKLCLDISNVSVHAGVVIKACAHILNTFYGQDIKFKEPIIFTAFGEGGIIRQHYKAEMDLRFVEVKKIRPLKRLTDSQIQNLLSNIYDLDLWLHYLPPENFEFHGMVVGNLIDITEQESLSRLKHVLLGRQAVTRKENITKMEGLLQTYFEKPDLRLGLTAVDYPLEFAVSHEYRIRHDFLSHRVPNLLGPEFNGSIYEKACVAGQTLTFESLPNLTRITKLEEYLIEEGIHSLVLAPLKSEDNRIIGLLEIGSSRPFELNSLTVLQLQEILPLFQTALERSREEVDNQIEVIIREKYTALHPSVEWQFVQNAFELLENREKEGAKAAIKPILFKNVYPLYGQSDIVGSSNLRNKATQADLLDNLELVRAILVESLQYFNFPIVEHFLDEIGRSRSRLKKGINSNDEFRIVEFLKGQVHPLLQDLKGKDATLRERIEGYFDHLDTEMGTVYRRRKDYEHSVVLLNDAITNHLESSQVEAQKSIPHYFERYKTDGVEFDIYVGQELLKNHTFQAIHLQNLRLWQLIVMCEIGRVVRDIRPGLPVPLDTAQLILVHSAPLSIRFRMDEKQFDVDGAYNIRYAIIKKRIDKALVKGTNERLTLADKVAIVYADSKDKEEYIGYLQFLARKKYIKDKIEDLELEPMQGVQGLKALRVTILT